MKRSIKSLLATIVISLSLATPVLAEPFKEGVAAYKRGDFSTALLLFRALADRGDAKAQFSVGVMYYRGDGGRRVTGTDNIKLAKRWWRSAAEQGYADAQYNHGVMSRYHAEKVRWFRKAAEQGHAIAQFEIAEIYQSQMFSALDSRDNRAVAQNQAEAMKWHQKAAEQGHAEAQFHLGWMYHGVGGVAQDLAEAAKWYRKAAEQGLAEAQSQLGVMYRDGEGVGQDFAEAVKWYRKAAEQGVYYAQFDLGAMYAEGKGVPQDYSVALAWYRKAAEQGLDKAQYRLGDLYHSGRGVSQDHAEAAAWYRKAAEQGHAEAQKSLAVMYEKGEGVLQDYVEAHKWTNLAVSSYSETEAENRKEAIRLRNTLTELMTPTQIAKAQRLAREWESSGGIDWVKEIFEGGTRLILSLPADKKPAPESEQSWIHLASLPSARPIKTELKPKEVFRLVSPSVWIVYAADSMQALKTENSEVAQGSAVAVSKSKLLTNCHVISDRGVLVIRQKDRQLNAKLSSADTATDRCVLEVQKGQLKAVPGVRTSGSLEVGERVFTIGSPRGLENTLGDGVISGLRKRNGVSLVQTTAPISPGSSGGGLFDEFGNLIGVTTSYLKESDALNFAIAASEYWR